MHSLGTANKNNRSWTLWVKHNVQKIPLKRRLKRKNGARASPGRPEKRATIKINDALIGAVVSVQCVAVGKRATVLYLAATPVLLLILSTRVRSHFPPDWAILSKLSDPVKYYNLWQEWRRGMRTEATTLGARWKTQPSRQKLPNNS